MKKLNFLTLFVLAAMLGFSVNLTAQDLGPDPVFGVWSNYTVVDEANWHVYGDTLTTAAGMTPRLDPGNDDWQWWNYAYHCADLAVAGESFDADFELQVRLKMPDSTTTGYFDAALIFDYVDEYNYNMFCLWRNNGSCFYTVINGVRAQVGNIAYKTFLEQTNGKNNWHDVRVLRIGNKLSAFFDNNPVVSVEDASLATGGKLGIGTLNDSVWFKEIMAWIPPIQFADDATWGNLATYGAINPGGVVVDTMGQDTLLYLKSGNPRLDPGNDDWQWWNYPFHLANIAYNPTQVYGDITMEVDIMKPESANANGNWDCGVVFGMESAYDYNVLWLYNKTNSTKLSSVKNGIREDLVINPDSLLLDNDLHTWKIVRAGNVVTCYLDDVEILTADDAKLGAAGMLGVGSDNDPAYFDNIVVTGTPTTVSDENELLETTYGYIEGKTILDVFPLTGVTAKMMVDGATISAGATAMIMNDTMAVIPDGEDVTNGMYLGVKAENGVINLYEIFLYVLSSDRDISWFGLGDISASNDSLLGIFEGVKVVTLKENIGVHDSATFIVTDSDDNEVGDDVEVVSDMKVKVTAEDGHSRTYIIQVVAAPWPTLDIVKVEAANKPVIDEFFDDWADFTEEPVDVPGGDDGELPHPSGPDDLSVYFKSVWDDEGLYMYFNFQDDIINYAAEDDWERDGIEVAILVTDDAGKRAAYNAWWQPEIRTWEQKYTLTYGMTQMEALWPNRDMTGCDFAWYNRDDGKGWELEVFWTWTALNGNGGLYTFVPGPGKKISVQMMVNDSDEEPERQHSLFWWDIYGTNQDASEYAMLRLITGTNVSELQETNVGIYPNPVENTLFFTGEETIVNAQICNVLGQVVRNYADIRGNSINVENLVSGVYLISVETKEGSTATARFLKK
jgi:hypothetical protein